MLSTKDLVFKEWSARKLVDQYVGLYIINEVISINEIKLWLPTSIRIYLVVNISQEVRYRESEETESRRSETSGGRWSQRIEGEKNTKQKKIRGVVKYSVR